MFSNELHFISTVSIQCLCLLCFFGIAARIRWSSVYRLANLMSFFLCIPFYTGVTESQPCHYEKFITNFNCKMIFWAFLCRYIIGSRMAIFLTIEREFPFNGISSPPMQWLDSIVCFNDCKLVRGSLIFNKYHSIRFCSLLDWFCGWHCRYSLDSFFFLVATSFQFECLCLLAFQMGDKLWMCADGSRCEIRLGVNMMPSGNLIQ